MAQCTVENIVSDVLNVYNRPEWPGAGILVQHFAKVLQNHIQLLNSKGKAAATNVPNINFLLRVYGDIYRRVKVCWLACGWLVQQRGAHAIVRSMLFISAPC